MIECHLDEGGVFIARWSHNIVMLLGCGMNTTQLWKTWIIATKYL